MYVQETLVSLLHIANEAIVSSPNAEFFYDFVKPHVNIGPSMVHLDTVMPASLDNQAKLGGTVNYMGIYSFGSECVPLGTSPDD